MCLPLSDVPCKCRMRRGFGIGDEPHMSQPPSMTPRAPWHKAWSSQVTSGENTREVNLDTCNCSCEMGHVRLVLHIM